MESMTTVEVGRGPYTYADLAGLPEDGPRHELIDGELFVSASPRPVHQTVAFNLAMLLHAELPRELRVYGNGVDIVLAPNTVLVPDVVVVRRADIAEHNIPAVPVLAVEVLSPSTRSVDLVSKKNRLERAGCEHYWIVDADIPAVTCWQLIDGRYHQTVHAEHDQLATVEHPVALRFTPSQLIE